MNRRRFLTVTVGIMVLSAGLVLANYGGGVTPAGAKDLTSVTPNWDQNLPSASRFTVLSDFGGAAVRDNNTGLVWEQAPLDFSVPWAQATSYCLNKSVPAEGPRGWRLPSIVELLSLINGNSPPPASVFTGVLAANYWSATTAAETPERDPSLQLAWVAIFSDGHFTRELKTQSRRAWCVRGGMNADQY